MKRIFLQCVGLLLLAGVFNSCATTTAAKAPIDVTDLVCGMKVNNADAFTYKYKEKKYYFDSYNCKETFKMNPEKFLTNNCTPK